MARKRDEDDEPITPEEVRQYARDLIMSREMRVHIAKKALTDDRFLLAMLKLASDEMDPSARDVGQIPQGVNLRIINAVMAMPSEVQRQYAETGKLPERYWELQADGNGRK